MNYFLYAPEMACYDGEADAAAAAATPPPEDKTFTQDDVNKFLAEDRRKHTERYQKLEQSYEGILADKNLASESRIQVETELEDLRSSLRTKEQQIEYEKKQDREQYKIKLTAAEKEAKDFKGLYTNTVIDQALQRAAGSGDAFNDDLIVSLLKPMTQLRDQHDEEGKPTGKTAPMTELSDIDEKTGEPIQTLRTPMDAVKRMKELPDLYGGLFRANVVSGIGQGAATGGVTPGSGQPVDVTKLTPEQYRKIRKENPALLGLRAQ